MMEFQSPPTSLTAEEQDAYQRFDKRLNFLHDLRDAEDFLKWHWMRTEVSPGPLEIKYYVLEDDAVKALAEFEDRSAFLESQHCLEEGRMFTASGYRYENTTQHSAVLTFGYGRVKYVVMWIEKDAEVGHDA